MASHERCPLCQATDFTGHRFGLMRYTACGLIGDPAIFEPTKGETLNLEFFGEGWAPESSFWVRLFQRQKNRRYLRNIRQHVKGGRLLEIGVGSGRFLEQARALGFEVLGCDLSPAVCQRAEAEVGVKVHCGRVDDLPEGDFDVVAMHHVLERGEDPVGLLRSVHKVLKAGGIVHIAVPNIACWEARLSGWTSYEPYHLSYFSPSTLGRTVAAAGFSTERLATWETFSGWFLAVLRTALGGQPGGGAVARPVRSAAGRAHGGRSGLVEHAYRLAMVLTGVVLWPLRRVQGWLGRGDELICIARKPLGPAPAQGLDG